ncbi:aldo/keto reductase [Pelagicoccus albus]|uniref:aldo/keto reductase n=1 Tax=Pelagicoccus albus TaxID=415222 RepID=UPI0030DBAF74
MIKYRQLGNSSIKISEWSLGCSGIGGPNQMDGGNWGWPNVSDESVLRSVELAVEFGVNHFDVADLYGQGRAERRLSWALRELGLRTENFIIASKVGFLKGTAEHPYDPWHMKRQCEQSLRNLGRDYLDIYYLHNAEFGEEDRWLEPAATALEQLQQEGKIRLKGQSAYSTSDFQKTIPVIQPTVIQSRSNLIDNYFTQPGSPVSKIMEKRNISFIAFSPLEQGLLAGAYHPAKPPKFERGEARLNNLRFKSDYLEKLQPKLDAVMAQFKISRAELPSIAIRYVLDQPSVAAVINGFQKPEDIKSSSKATERDLSSEEHTFLDNLFADLRHPL